MRLADRSLRCLFRIEWRLRQLRGRWPMDRRVRTDGSGFGLVVGHGHPSMDVEVEVVPVTHNPSGGVDTPRGSLEGSTLDGIVVVELGELVVCPEEGIGPSLGIAAGTYDLVGGVQPVGLCLNYSWEGCIETYVPDLRVEVTVGCRIFRKLGPNPNKITASVDVGDTCGIGSGNVDV